MKSKKLLTLTLLLLLISVLTLSACGKRPDGPTPTPDDPPVLQHPLSEQEIAALFTKLVDTSSSFTLNKTYYSGGSDSGVELKYSAGTSPKAYVADRYEQQVSEYYLGKKGDTYYYFGIEDSDVGYQKLTDIQFQLLINDLLEEYTIDSDFFVMLNQDSIIAKSIDESLGIVSLAGTRFVNEQQELERIEITAFCKNAYGYFAEAVNYSFEFDNQERLNKITYDSQIDAEYLPTSLSLDMQEEYNSSRTITIEYGEVEITLPGLADGEDISASTVSLYLVDSYGVELSEYSFDADTEITIADYLSVPEAVEPFFEGLYYDYQYQHPVSNTLELGCFQHYELYCKWNIPKVTLEPNGGQLLFSQTLYSLNDCYYYDPVRTGYAFAGWHADSELTQEIDEDNYDLIVAPITLYAKWQPYVKVVFNADLGYKVLPKIGLEGEEIYYPDTYIAKKEYIFRGWYSDEETAIPAPMQFPASSITVYAQFEHAWCITFVQDPKFNIKYSTKYINVEKLAEPTQDDFEGVYTSITYHFYLVDGDGERRVFDAGGGKRYIFDDWYTDPSYLHKFSEYPDANMVLYAKFDIYNPD